MRILVAVLITLFSVHAISEIDVFDEGQMDFVMNGIKNSDPGDLARFTIQMGNGSTRRMKSSEVKSSMHITEIVDRTNLINETVIVRQNEEIIRLLRVIAEK